jgi:hypothetical protein
MEVYNLIKAADSSSVTILKNGIQISFYTEVFDTGTDIHGWGGWKGSPAQIAFALCYDYTKDLEKSKAAYPILEKLIINAAPFEIDISTGSIDFALSQI